ncbi:hypothetical protein MMSR116_26445 [Methylobacterium mesophilicum SR1.6/6]|uniref:Uncharacterized protein n=1 Tax=Methylobacterium mesophilicum SR1.6/6 TaxID=908290 RepID=A0A6B9FSM2_9HYPH|nr:hypothetical protein [Methylobacterium mesophilicum]QGY05042.1 hypothetical protein MMSR116_26445 [Methylobacterium mesophilicum SR1.6/6]
MMSGEVDRLADESLRLSLRQAETVILLAVAVHYAWFEWWFEAHRSAASVCSARQDQRARTRRLIRLGVAPSAAARDLRLV